jgi:2-polyprenyl-3-methyl-5-hydroxy-6-metoxy-1,4-benzoquinol methylase
MKEKNLWQQTADMLGNEKVAFGRHWSYNFRNDPKRLSFVLSRYKFAAKMACDNADVLELGCSEGIGATILNEIAKSYTGVDLDKSAIETAKANLPSDNFKFIYDDFMGKKYGLFKAIVSMDVIEHIDPQYEKQFFQTILDNLSDDGICVIGTPNITSEPYASEASKLGHINLYSQNRLKKELNKYFHQVLPFGMNDENVHTGFAAMAHFIICVAFHKKDDNYA